MRAAVGLLDALPSRGCWGRDGAGARGLRRNLDELKRRVHEARFTLQRRANAELVALYRHIGATILRKQESSAWERGS